MFEHFYNPYSGYIYHSPVQNYTYLDLLTYLRFKECLLTLSSIAKKIFLSQTLNLRFFLKYKGNFNKF